MTDITLYEKVNKQKLKEVLECDNIPFEKSDNKEWKDSFLKTLYFYNKKDILQKVSKQNIYNLINMEDIIQNADYKLFKEK